MTELNKPASIATEMTPRYHCSVLATKISSSQFARNTYPFYSIVHRNLPGNYLALKPFKRLIMSSDPNK